MPTNIPLPRKPANRGEADDRLIAEGQVELVNAILDGVARVRAQIRLRFGGAAR